MGAVTDFYIWREYIPSVCERYGKKPEDVEELFKKHGFDIFPDDNWNISKIVMHDDAKLGYALFFIESIAEYVFAGSYFYFPETSIYYKREADGSFRLHKL